MDDHEYEREIEILVDDEGSVIVPCRCGSGLDCGFCMDCYAHVCPRCHQIHASERVAEATEELSLRTSFNNYIKLLDALRHADKCGGFLKTARAKSVVEIRTLMTSARSKLIERYGIDPERGDASTLYRDVRERRYVKWLVRESLRASFESARLYAAGLGVSNPDDVAKMLLKNLERMFKGEYAETLRLLENHIKLNYAHYILSRELDNDFEYECELLTKLCSAVGRRFKGVEAVIREKIPVTLRNLRDDDEDIITVRRLYRLLDDAWSVHESARKLRDRGQKRVERAKAAEILREAESLFSDELVDRIRQKFPEVSSIVISRIRSDISRLRGALRGFIDTCGEHVEPASGSLGQFTLDMFREYV